jgi:hypothetical protein
MASLPQSTAAMISITTTGWSTQLDLLVYQQLPLWDMIQMTSWKKLQLTDKHAELKTLRLSGTTSGGMQPNPTFQGTIMIGRTQVAMYTQMAPETGKA